ncbi:hypothetical protein L6452_05370 [Arctium lappa]|uniref:Uncharacterized protein n=1 Tax=Arctium lappa TaxID=4217 RepID=A0ACB9EHA0_ARCLA|nr:hypothetical protein L6452_05370 [Arctium lappa]
MCVVGELFNAESLAYITSSIAFLDPIKIRNLIALDSVNICIYLPMPIMCRNMNSFVLISSVCCGKGR